MVKKNDMQHLMLAISIFAFSMVQKMTAQEKHRIKVEFNGMKSDSGNLYIALYDKEKDFLKKAIKGKIIEVHNKKATVYFNNVPKGEYAISAFHDENKNEKMDTNIFGIPKEPIGISNNAKGFMGPPKFKNAKFLVQGNISLSITID